ncbi:hypothetical protein [Flavonifractor sp. An91]|uniref:hypothetical protein n=1 Tax=Flavonifractor sp. An91 TaxID=1965665 RepID=UPI000B39D70F|nr:hypothetical protein [Flavonifractor sp. An91]OUN08448.1 hypothetical protein B5G42_14500 [Flavonifractor sp. An91]
MSDTVNRLVYGELIFTDQEIQEGETYEATALLSDALEIGTFQMELYLRDENKGAALTGFRRNDKLLYYHRERLQGTYYIESVERTGKFTYTITANNALALLDQSDHMGGIYTGQTVEELVAEICNIPYQVQTKFAKVKLYGWLPVATRRANLAQVLFAVGAQAKVDQVGTLRIEALWDGVSSAITPDRVFWGDKVRYEAQVTEVSVLEHQYIPGTEEIQLFEGTTQSGDVIQFQEPVHSLAASGFSLLEQGANYAKVSAGTGTLTGKKYVHTTRDVRQAVTPDDVANVVEVKEATLVSLVNSAAVAERLAEYYKWIEAMEATVVYDGERPGDVIAFEHPFGGASVGCVKSASITIGGRLVAEEVTAIGYKPPSSDIVEIYDVRKLITTNDPIVVPDGVTKMRAVLISGGTAGQNGTDGEPGADGESARCSAGDNGEFTSGSQGAGGAGGSKGLGGSGGKVYSVDIEVLPGQVISPNIGLGGVASDISGEQGAAGSATTLTVGGVVYTSDDGSASPSGYTDLVTGEVFAATGPDGVDGGAGGKSASKSASAENGTDVSESTGGKLSTGNKVGDDSKYGPWIYQSSSDYKQKITEEFNKKLYSGHDSYKRDNGAFISSGSKINIGYSYMGPSIKTGTVYADFTRTSIPTGETGTVAITSSSMVETEVRDLGYEDAKVYQWRHQASITHKRSRAESTYGNLGAGGGGAANGVNGNDATPTCEGGAGADAVTPEIPDKIGTGGTGGSGGGGGGAGGNGYISVEGNDGDVAYSKYQSGMMGGPGGKFGKGSNGAPGGIILYYGEPKVIVSGPLKEKNNRQFLDRHGRRFTV